MRFEAPEMLLFGLLALPLAALFLVRRRRHERRTAYLFLWLEALERERIEPRWVVEWLRLLLQLVVLSLWTVALASPVTGRREGTHRQLLVLDNSASMQAAAGGRSRFESARRQATAWLRPGTATTVMVTAPAPRIVARDLDPAMAAEALAGLAPSAWPGDFAELLALLDAQTERYQERVLFSDGCGPGAEALAGRAAQLARVAPPGYWPANLALGEVRADPLAQRPGWRISCEVVNHGQSTERRELQLGKQRRSLSVPAGGRATVDFELPADASERQQLRLWPPDALTLDDTARIVVPRQPRARVTLVSPGEANPFLQRALAALGPWIHQPWRELDSAVWPPPGAAADPAGFAVTILDGVRLRAALPAGRFVLFDPRGTSPVRQGGQRQNLAVWQTEGQHPVMRHVQLSELLVRRARPMVPRAEEGFRVLARCSDGGLIAVRPGVVVFAFRPADSNLPGLIAFPLLLKNILQWFALQSRRAPLAVPLGHPLSGRRPAGPGWVSVDGEQVGVNLQSPTESLLRQPRGGAPRKPTPLQPALRRYGGWFAWGGMLLALTGLLVPGLRPVSGRSGHDDSAAPVGLL